MKLKKIWLWLWLIVDVIYTLFFGLFFTVEVLMQPMGATDPFDIALSVIAEIAGLYFIAVSVKCLINISRGKRYVVLINLLAKIAGGLIIFSFIYFPPFALLGGDEIYAFLTFLITGVLFGVILFYVIFSAGKTGKEKKHTSFLKLPEFSSYISEHHLKFAAEEYVEIKNLSPDYELCGEDNEKISGYAAMPIVYFFWWLLENKFMSDSFYENHTENEIKSVLNREVTPLEFFIKSCNGNLLRDDISEVVRCFTDHYFADFDAFRSVHRINAADYFQFDYYEAVRNEKKSFYCIEFEWKICEKLSRRITERFKEYKTKPLRYADFDETGKRDIDFIWKLKNARLTVICPLNLSSEYIKKCEADLNSLNGFQIEMFCRMVERVYNSDLEAFDMFEPMEVVIFTPHSEEPVYVIVGETEYEQEHGIAIYIRNGAVIGFDYASTLINPWKMKDEYETYKDGIDFSKCNEKSFFDELVSNGTLVWYEYDDTNKFYVTKYAAECLDEVRMRNEALCAMRVCENVEVKPKFREENPVPEKIDFRANEVHIRNVSFYEIIRVWL